MKIRAATAQAVLPISMAETRAAGAGIINQKSDKAITIDHYSGNTTVNFGTLTQNGNGVTISAAAANSGITMSGDRGGLSETEAMGRLAGKLTYTAYVNGGTKPERHGETE